MTTYKQPEKDKSRVLLWNHAVESLTSLRDSNRILNTTYMEHLWLYCQQQLNEKLDIELLFSGSNMQIFVTRPRSQKNSRLLSSAVMNQRMM